MTSPEEFQSNSTSGITSGCIFAGIFASFNSDLLIEDDEEEEEDVALIDDVVEGLSGSSGLKLRFDA